jgi:glycosyltransferase involved in cell wall biosynthesis
VNIRVWLITVGEPLPTDGGNDRLLRAGILADLLHGRGYDVTWWTSTFDHVRKRHRFESDTTLDRKPGYRMILLHGAAYTKDVSLRRIVNHWGTARAFARLAEAEAPPDVVLCSLPTLELSVAATAYGRRHGVPVLVDVRDLWPDVIVDYAPRPFRWLARLLLAPMQRQARAACRAATGILGTTPEYVQWGLRHAGRGRGDFDGSFPMAYVATEPPPDALAAAEMFWRQHGLATERSEFVACFCGRIGHHNDFDTVIEAARRLRECGKGCRFVLCGTGGKLDHYRDRAKDLDNVIFPGWVGAADIWTLMRRSAVGLAPLREIDNYVHNLPNKPAEYFSAGLPVVTSLNTGVLRDLLDRHDCGLTYQNGEPETLVEALAKLLDDRERRDRMSANARALYRQTFVAEKVYGELADFMETVVGRFRGTGCPARPDGLGTPSCTQAPAS